MIRRDFPLVVVAASLFGLLAWEMFWPFPLPVLSEANNAPGAESLLPTMPPPPPNDLFAASDQRPLFTPTRRPAPPPPIAPTITPAPPLPQLRLIGVLSGPNQRLALLKPVNAPAFTAAPDQVVEGWTVSDIAADRVTLRYGDALETLNLHEQKP